MIMFVVLYALASTALCLVNPLLVDASILKRSLKGYSIEKFRSIIPHARALDRSTDPVLFDNRGYQAYALSRFFLTIL